MESGLIIFIVVFGAILFSAALISWKMLKHFKNLSDGSESLNEMRKEEKNKKI